MKLRCPECGEICESLIFQRISSRKCHIKSYFSIIEIKCIGCGKTGIFNLTPKDIKVYNEFEKMIKFQ